jgi:hypothetical protein
MRRPDHRHTDGQSQNLLLRAVVARKRANPNIELVWEEAK